MALGNSNKDKMDFSSLRQSLEQTADPTNIRQTSSSDPTSSEQMATRLPTDLDELVKIVVKTRTTEELDKLIADLNERMKKLEDANIEKVPIQDLKEYIILLSKCFKLCLENNGIFVEHYKDAVASIQTINKNSEFYSQNIQKLKIVLEILQKELDISPVIVKQPIVPQAFKDAPVFIFRDIPFYWFKRLYYSRHIRHFVAIIVCSFYVATIGLLGFVARDNAQLRKDKEKTILIRKVLRGNGDNKNAVKTIDYIDMLYVDEEAHQDEIRKLWK